MDKIERTWNRKLEEPDVDPDEPSQDPTDPEKASDDENDGQIDIQKLLDKIASKRVPGREENHLGRSQSVHLGDDDK